MNFLKNISIPYCFSNITRLSFAWGAATRTSDREVGSKKTVQFFFLNIGSIGTTLVWKSLPFSQTSKKCFLLFLLQSKFLVVRVPKNLFYDLIVIF